MRKPVIAAVAGFALGGGCELAMMCDFIIAADTAKFGQPEIKLGIIPGAGGTQRLPRAVGKCKAMDMVLTCRMMDAAEAERAGLVSRVVAADKLLDEALAAARAICDLSGPSLMMAKESVNRAFEGRLAEGVSTSAGCSTRCSPPKTRKKAWTPSSPSASRPSSTADAGAAQACSQVAPVASKRARRCPSACSSSQSMDSTRAVTTAKWPRESRSGPAGACVGLPGGSGDSSPARPA